jgi:hypothetical protein
MKGGEAVEYRHYSVIVGPCDIYINGVRQYCDACCSQAAKAKRPVRRVPSLDGDYCGLCEMRARNGLVFYCPSNGTEGDIFEERCEQCRHFIDDREDPKPPRLERPFVTCKWGVRDRLLTAMWHDRDHISNWYDAADLTRYGLNGELLCPARCLRFTHEDDRDGERRDPPPPDCRGQMFLGEMLTVRERVPGVLPAAEARHG